MALPETKVFGAVIHPIIGTDPGVCLGDDCMAPAQWLVREEHGDDDLVYHACDAHIAACSRWVMEDGREDDD